MKWQNTYRNLHLLSLVVICLLFLPCAAAATKPPVITSITPENSADGTNVTLTLRGSGFENGAKIILTPVNITPVLIGSIPKGSTDAFLIRPTKLIVSGDYAFVTGPENLLDIINISDPTAPVHTTRIKTRTNGIDMAIAGPYAYIIGGNALDIIDISNPAKPVHAGFISSDTSDTILHAAYGIGISHNHAYIVSILTNTIEVFDITDREKPVFRSRIRSGDFGARFGDPNSICVTGNRAYVTSSERNTFEILDITNPVMPDHMGYLRDGMGGAHLTSPFHTCVQGNYAYVANYQDNSLEIVNISDPYNPVHAGILPMADNIAEESDPFGMKIFGNYLFVGTQNTLDIIDITDPDHPNLKYSTNNAESPYIKGPRASFDIVGRYAYIIRTHILSGHDMTDMDFINTLDIFDLGFTPATNITIQTPDNASCSVDLDGRPPGLYNVVLTNPDGQIGVLQRGFEIQAPPEPATYKTEPSVTQPSPSADSSPLFALIGLLMLAFIFRKTR